MVRKLILKEQRRESNDEFLSRIMTFARSGPVMQLFIIDSLAKMAKSVANTPIEQVREAFGADSFVHPDAWHAAAVELLKELDARLGK